MPHNNRMVAANPKQDRPLSAGNLIKVSNVNQHVFTHTNVTSAEKVTRNVTVHSGPLDQVPNEFFSVTRDVNTPVNVDLLENLLNQHPDRALVDFVVSGFRYGFRLGFREDYSSLVSASKNNKSAFEYKEKVDEAILKELNRGHTVGPFSSVPCNFHCSPLGAAPKKDGSVRVVLDLSSPRGHSVNDGILKEDYTVNYSSFDDAVDLVKKLGRGCYLAKLDVKHAFRLCPVHKKDWHLLGYKWQGKYYHDLVLPFGGRSSPFIFNHFADLLAWIIVFILFIENLLHYLDDFLTASPLKEECKTFIDSICQLCHQLGVPLAPEKIVGPYQVITYLGIEIDTVNFVIRLPQDKLQSLMQSLQDWQKRKKCTKKELLSLIGSLFFACKVVKCGRMFLRRLIDLSRFLVCIISLI